MPKPLTQLRYSDLARFLRERGVAASKACPACGREEQFGVDNFDDGNQSQLFLTDDPDLAYRTLAEINWACDNCGFSCQYHTQPFIEWAAKQ